MSCTIERLKLIGFRVTQYSEIGSGGARLIVPGGKLEFTMA